METPDLLISRNSFPCTDGFSMPAYVTRPKSAAKLPALLFIYEIFGLSTEMERVANDFASSGYVVMVPDLFSRGSWFSCIRKVMADIKSGAGRNVQDLLAARSWLVQQDFVDPNHVATIGFCMGGAFALILAKTGLFRVSAPFYGHAPERLDGACPIVGSYGERDKPTLSEAEKLRKELARLEIPNDVKVYPDAGHGFMSRPPNAALGFLFSISPMHAGYNPVAAADAKARVLSFLEAHI